MLPAPDAPKNQIKNWARDPSTSSKISAGITFRCIDEQRGRELPLGCVFPTNAQQYPKSKNREEISVTAGERRVIVRKLWFEEVPNVVD